MKMVLLFMIFKVMKLIMIKNNIYKIIGMLLLIILIYFRFRDKMPRDIIQLDFLFVFLITVIFACYLILIIHRIIKYSFRKEKKSNEITNYFILYIIQPVNNFIKQSYSSFDYYIKDDLLGSKILGPFLNNSMVFFIRKIGVFFRDYRIAFIIFDIIPKCLIILVLFIDIIVFNHLRLVYYFSWMPLIPLIFRYIIFTFRDFIEFNIKDFVDKYIQIKSLDPEYYFSSQDIIDECCNIYKENIFDLCSQEYLNRDFAIPLNVGRLYILKDLVIDAYSDDNDIEHAFDELLLIFNNLRISRQIIYYIDNCRRYWYYLYFDLFRFLSYTLIWAYACTFHIDSILHFLLLTVYFENPF